MKKHILACFALAFSLVFLFSGCSLRFTALPNLLRPPKPIGEYSGLQEAFESYVATSTGKNFLLKTPITGDYRSSFIMYDVDNDGEEEAFVFYTPNKEQSTVRVHFMDSQNGQWTLHNDFPGIGSDVYSVAFADLNGDGVSEMLVGWNLFDSKESKMLSVYQYSSTENGPVINTLARETFSAMLPVDIDRDGSVEIFLLTPETTGTAHAAVGKLLKMENGSLAMVSKVMLDPKTLNYVSIKEEDLGIQVPLKIYIDANAGASGMITEIVYWNSQSQKLVAPLYDEKKGINPVTRRYEPIASRDINNDAIFEVPVQIILPDSGYASPNLLSSDAMGAVQTDPAVEEQKLYLTKWVQFQEFEPQTGKVVAYSSINYSDGYMFFYPDQWVEDEKIPKITIISNLQERRWTFFAMKNGKIGEELFNIWTLPAEQWEKSQNADYTLLKENGSVVYVARLSGAASQYDIDFDQLKTSISIIE